MKGSKSRDQILIGNMSKAEYLKIAGIVKSSLDANSIAPEFYENTSLGRFLGYESMIYMYLSILDSYNTTKVLPSNITVKPWVLIVNSTLSQARPVYITSDNIKTWNEDNNMINSIVSGLNALGLTAINWGIGPNTHYAILQNPNIPANALIVDIYGGACAGTIWEMGTNSYKQLVGSRKVFSIWMPPSAWDITGLAWLPRAHDDNFSPAWFTGLANPDQYLLNNGYHYIYSGDIDYITYSTYYEAITA